MKKKALVIGSNVSESFSPLIFNYWFKKYNIGATYFFKEIKAKNFKKEIKEILNDQELLGFNVTIPFKEEVIKYLDKLDKTAKKIGAVNTIKVTKKGNLKGYNSDIVGFEKSLLPLINKGHRRALILGTGGASKAIAYALKKNGIKFKFVSRNPKKKKEISYNDLTKKVLHKYQIIINSTPVGTSPNVDKYPDIPYQFLTKNHLLYDLIYNPEITTFLAKGRDKGADIKNGYEMLQLQAEESWDIWNNS